MPDEIGWPGEEDERILDRIHAEIPPPKYTDAELAEMRRRAGVAGDEEVLQAPSAERYLIDAMAAGLTEGDDPIVEEIGGRLYEVMSDGRRVPLIS